MGEQKKEEVDMNNIKINELQVAMSTEDKKLSLRSTIKLSSDEAKKSINDPNYFVAFPILKPFKIPGYESNPKPKEKTEINGAEGKPDQIKEEGKPPEQMEKLVENEEKDNLIKPKENGQLEKIQEVPDAGQEVEEKVQKEFFVEDLSKAPPKGLYFEVGYLLKVWMSFGIC